MARARRRDDRARLRRAGDRGEARPAGPLPVVDRDRGLIQDGIVLALVLAIARPRLATSSRCAGPQLGPASASRCSGSRSSRSTSSRCVYGALTHPGNEQGLTPSHWEPQHAAAYIANGDRHLHVHPVRRGADVPRARLLAARALRPLAGDPRASACCSGSRTACRLAAGDRRVRVRARVDPRRRPTASIPGCSCTRRSTWSRSSPPSRSTAEASIYIQLVRRLGSRRTRGARRSHPRARAAGPCGVTATPVRGPRRSTVTFTAACTLGGLPVELRRRRARASGSRCSTSTPAGAWHADADDRPRQPSRAAR